MEPDSQPATNNNVRNIALAGLGVLATISLVTALVVANMSSGKHRAERTADSERAKGSFSAAPSAPASDAADQAAGGGTGGDSNQATDQGTQDTHQNNGPLSGPKFANTSGFTE